MKKLNWNHLSELGLIERINKEILHPLGLAMFRELATGESGGAYVADDGIFSYSENFPFRNLSDQDVRIKLNAMMVAVGVCKTLGPGCKGCPDCPGKSICFVGFSGNEEASLAAAIAEASAKEIEKAADYMMDYLGIARDVTSVSKIALFEYAAKVRANGGAA